MVVFVGAILGMAGAVYQGLFRNPLADPYIIGSSSGAALGAVIAITTNLTHFYSLSFFAFLGGLGATILVYFITGIFGSRSDSMTLLLAGTALSSLFSALISIILTLHDRDLHRVFFWLLGSFSGKTTDSLISLSVAFILSIVGALLSSRVLDVLSAGDENALSMGVDPRKARLFVGGFMALGVATAVSVSGIIGFVGLISPHLARRLVGPAHKKLILLSTVIGSCMLIIADIVARSILPPLELPIGAITALIGAPYFLYKMARQGLRSL
jgi:iron complex transport system permease protein